MSNALKLVTTQLTMESSIASTIKRLGLRDRLNDPPTPKELESCAKPSEWQVEYEAENKRKARLAYSSLLEKDWQVTFENLRVVPQNEEPLNRLKKWEPEMKRGIVLCGPVGTGKSTACKAIINRFASSKFKCVFISMGDAMQQLRDAIGKKDTTVGDEMDKFISPNLLVIDDLGAEKTTDWATEKLFLIFEKRAASGKHTFFTTNCNPEDIGQLYKERILDRLFEFCTWVKMPGKSLRREYYAPEI